MQQLITDIFLTNLRNRVVNGFTDETLSKARECLLDFIGVSLAGAVTLKGKEQDVANQIETIDGCHVIGMQKKVNMHVAALLNGISSHVIELDDGHRIGMLHLGSPIISSLLAVAEKEEVSSKDFLNGIVVGYETAIRLACAIQPGHKLKGYHATGTCGTIGAAMAIATALRFDFEQMKSAFSAAVTSAAGVLEMIEGDTELKPFNAGRAAMDGVAAAYIGKARFKAPEDALGGKRGFLKVMTDNAKMDYILDFNNKRSMIETIYMKPYAACRHCHPSIEAALHIKENRSFKLDEVENIHIDTYKLAVAGHDHTDIKGSNSAKMSIPYSLAVALCTGKAGIDAYTERNIKNPKIQAITKKVSVTDIDELTALCPQKRVAIVTVNTKSGKFTERIEYPKGEPENPLTKQELEEKFYGLAIYGGLTKNECDVVIKEIENNNFNLAKIINVICK